MTILHSCCCWRSVRKGSYACGVYTGVYYTVNALQSSFLLHEELSYLKNVSNQSLIDHDITSETSLVFSALIFAFSSCGIITALLLFYGLYKDLKILLMPWIFNMVFFTMVDVMYIIYGLVVHALQWNPSVAILITIDFFLNTLNLYALLCVISQYQEYKAGRGRAIDEDSIRVPNVQYSSQPTATTYLSSKKAITCMETRPTPTHSPTESGIKQEMPPINRGPRKSVKFDRSELSMIQEPAWLDGKSASPVKGADTAPLIGSRVEANNLVVS
ncbi:uncharacterized protein LOC132707631 [Cylas formicarius]|uniref:uncharacterized protein LOC132707631 n=1 Tax=Cylas formicarius TaxID=197179 RepID=UPI002958CA36|nr:uncharacterized protein LOC132707631 [Cylas formicarius]